jgi:diguanylate cyclase (GGDEF)-like protein
VGDDKWQDFDDGDEATAVVNLADLRRQSPNKFAKTYHLLVHVQGTELGRVRELKADQTLIGRSTDADLWLGDDGVSRRHARLVRSGTDFILEDLKSANGTFVQGERITTRKLADGDQIQLGPAAIFRYSVTDDDQKALLEQLYSTSVTDSLTGARNREYLDSLLITELSYAERHDHDLSFVLFDLDHFKSVNDTYGHPAGDSVLIAVAEAVRNQLRAEDSLCRYGGEEFCVVLRTIDLAGAHAMGERIRAVIQDLTIEHEALKLKATTSVGCSTRRELPEPSAASLISLADQRLYKAKKAGRNRVISS